MNVTCKVLEIQFDATIAKNGGGSYKGTRISYRDADGALKEKGIHTNALKYNPTLKKQLEGIKGGDDITMVMEKEGEYWNLKEVHKGTVEPVPNAAPGNAGTRSGNTANVSPKSTYETPEERARRQVLIVRQSSVSSAIAYAATLKSHTPFNEVLKMAEQINAFVFQSEFDDGSIETLQSDIL